MHLHMIAVGKKMPLWVQNAFDEYKKRFPKDFSFTLTEVPAAKRTPSTPVKQILEKEGEKILDALIPKALTIALDERGTSWNTQELSKEMRNWQNKTSAVNFLIGGPDGLSTNCLTRANAQWSLSPLTLPHPLVRIIVIEQLYRAMTILNNHPYHRD